MVCKRLVFVNGTSAGKTEARIEVDLGSAGRTGEGMGKLGAVCVLYRKEEIAALYVVKENRTGCDQCKCEIDEIG